MENSICFVVFFFESFPQKASFASNFPVKQQLHQSSLHKFFHLVIYFIEPTITNNTLFTWVITRTHAIKYNHLYKIDSILFIKDQKTSPHIISDFTIYDSKTVAQIKKFQKSDTQKGRFLRLEALGLICLICLIYYTLFLLQTPVKSNLICSLQKYHSINAIFYFKSKLLPNKSK